MAIGLSCCRLTSHLSGTSAYGLWMLTTSVTGYFTTLQLGYGGAIVKFVAEFRAKRDPQALNEVLSTMFFVYAGIGALAYCWRSSSPGICRHCVQPGAGGGAHRPNGAADHRRPMALCFPFRCSAASSTDSNATTSTTSSARSSHRGGGRAGGGAAGRLRPGRSGRRNDRDPDDPVSDLPGQRLPRLPRTGMRLSFSAGSGCGS